MIAVVTAYESSWAELGALTAATKRAWCETHGYVFFDCCWPVEGLHPSWMKFSLLETLVPSFEWVMWTDADAVVVNPERRLEEFTEQGGDFLISDDGGGPNAGNYLVRNTGEGLRRLWHNLRRWEAEHPNEVNYSPWEQRALQRAIFDGAVPGCRIVDQRWFNAYHPKWYDGAKGCYHEGDLMLHFPGGTLEWKIERVREWVRQ